MVKIPWSRSLAPILVLILFCASCITPSETAVVTEEGIEPSVTSIAMKETSSPTQRPPDTPIPIPTSKPQLTISFENVNRLEQKLVIQQDDGWIKNLSFSADGTLLAAAATHDELMIWRVDDGSVEVSLKGHTARITCAAFSPDGKYLSTGSQDTSIILWDVSDWSIVKKLNGHESFVNSVAFSPNSKFLASGGEDRRVILWQVESGEALHRFDDPIQWLRKVEFSSDSGMIAAASAENRARVWLVESGEMLWKVLGPSGITSLAFTPHGSILATASGSCWPTDTGCDPISPIIFWDMSDGSQIRTTEEKTLVIDIVFSPDGNLLFAGIDMENSIEVFRVADGSVLWHLMGHEQRITALAISPDGTLFASGDSSGKIILWGLPEN